MNLWIIVQILSDFIIDLPGIIQMAVFQQNQRPEQAQARAAVDDMFGQKGMGFANTAHAFFIPQQNAASLFQYIRRFIRLPGKKRMTDGLNYMALIQIHFRRPQVQAFQSFRV